MGSMPQIKGREKVTSVFGRWPAFHDAEIISLRLDRGAPPSGFRPYVDLVLHAWEMTSEVGPGGHYVLRNHVLVTFRFSGLHDLKLEGFNPQNVLYGLEIEPAKANHDPHINFEVRLDASYGVDGSFTCREAEILDVRPCSPDGTPL